MNKYCPKYLNPFKNGFRTVIPFFIALLMLGFASHCASEAQYIEQGQILAGQRNYNDAIKNFLLALEKNPDSHVAHLNMGYVYLQTKRYTEAIKAIEQAQKIKESAEAFVGLSIVHYSRKQYKKAAESIEKALVLEPNNASYHYRLGMILKEAGDIDKAAESFEMALVHDPQHVETIEQLAVVFIELQRYQDAQDILKNALKDFRGDSKKASVLYAVLGEVYEAMDMLDYAKHNHKMALQNNAKNDLAIAGYARVLRLQGNIEKAIEGLRNAVSSQPKSASIRLELGLAYRDFRMEAQAVKELLKAVDLDSDNTSAFPPLLALLEKQKDTTNLFKIVLLAANAMPDDKDIQLRAGHSAYKNKKYKNAIKYYKRVLEIEPANIDGNYYLGLCQLKLGQKEEAIQTLNTLQILDEAKAVDLWRQIEGGGKKPPVKTKKKRRNRRRRR